MVLVTEDFLANEWNYTPIFRFGSRVISLEKLVIGSLAMWCEVPDLTSSLLSTRDGPLLNLRDLQIYKQVIKASSLGGFLALNQQLVSICVKSCSLIGGSWKSLLVLLRDGFPDLLAFRFERNKYAHAVLEPCTVWDGRPIIVTWHLDTSTTSTPQEYICANCLEHDFFTMLQEIIEEKGMRQALHDMVAGYREAGIYDL